MKLTRLVVGFLAPVVGLLSAGCGDESTRGSAHRPGGVILVSVDTLRADHLPVHGYRGVATPAIDELATAGIVFEQAISPVPITLPSHASLLTGTLPLYHGVRDNSGFVLPADETALAELLKERGFQTGAFVGAFVLDSRFGLDQGFDYYHDGFQTDTLDTVRLEISERRASEVLAEARRWITSRDESRPFFAFIHLFDPHAPYDAPAPFSQPGLHPYDAEIAYVDAQLAEFWDFLRQARVYDSSTIVFTSDHGEGLGDHGEATHGMFLYDSTLHVPLIVKPAGWRGAGKRVGDQVRLIDVAPTILQLVNVPVPGQSQGRSLVEAWTTGRLPKLAALSETQLPLLNYGWSDLQAYRLPERKLIEAPRPELYSPVEDSGERRNLYREDLPELARLRSARDNLVKTCSKPTSGAARRVLDSESVARLRTLGYLGSSPARPAATRREHLADPKDKIGLFNKIWDAQSLSLRGRHQESAASLAGVIAQDPSIFMAQSIQALNFLEMGNPLRAIPHLRAAVTLRQDDPGSHFYLGMASLQVDRLEQAAVEFQKAFQLDPENDAALNNLATVFMRQKRFDQAAGLLRRIVERTPTDAAAHLNLGVAELNRQGFDQALRAFEEAARLHPGLPEAQNNIGLVYLRTERPDQAIPYFEQALRLRPDYPNAHYNLGQAYRQKGMGAQAEEQFRLAGAAGN